MPVLLPLVEPWFELGLDLKQHDARIDERFSFVGPDPGQLENVADQVIHGAAGLLDAVDEMAARLVQVVAVILS